MLTDTSAFIVGASARNNGESDMAIEWRIALPDEVLAEYAGTRLGQYFTDARVMYDTQVRGAEIFNQTFGYPIVGADPHVAVPAYAQAAALGSTLVINDDLVPMLTEDGAPNRGDVGRIEIPARYLETEVMARYVRIREEMCAIHGSPVSMGVGLEGPVTTAKLVRGQEFFIDVYEDPSAAHALLDICTESYIRFFTEVRKFLGQLCGQSIGIADDFSGLFSPAAYAEFVQPYHRRIYEALGVEHRSLHSELLRRDHLKFLSELKIDSFDPGQDQYLELADLQEELDPRGIPFWYNVKTVAALEGTPESLREEIDIVVSSGTTRLMAELTPGTPRVNVVAILEAFLSYGG
jgi:uroporphyrinogen-III decarboxylase